MGALSTAARNRLRASQFAGPDRSYPIPDKTHAQNALARARQQLNAGNLTQAEYQAIVRKARRKLMSNSR